MKTTFDQDTIHDESDVYDVDSAEEEDFYEEEISKDKQEDKGLPESGFGSTLHSSAVEENELK